jgi:hypothetical protein
MTIGHWVLLAGFGIVAVICIQPIKLWKAITSSIQGWKLTSPRRFFGRE